MEIPRCRCSPRGRGPFRLSRPREPPSLGTVASQAWTRRAAPHGRRAPGSHRRAAFLKRGFVPGKRPPGGGAAAELPIEVCVTPLGNQSSAGHLGAKRSAGREHGGRVGRAGQLSALETGSVRPRAVLPHNLPPQQPPSQPLPTDAAGMGAALVTSLKAPLEPPGDGNPHGPGPEGTALRITRETRARPHDGLMFNARASLGGPALVFLLGVALCSPAGLLHLAPPQSGHL